MSDTVGGAGRNAGEEPAARDDGWGESQGSETDGGQGLAATRDLPAADGADGAGGVEGADGADGAGSVEGAEGVEGADGLGPDADRGAVRTRRTRRSRRLRRLKVGLLVVTVTTSLGVATAFGLAAWDIQHLTHNLKHTALLPSGFTEPPELVDAYGRSPINILLIGSDTRDTAADCALGGACTAGAANSGANGDSEMLVHLSADRSNVTVLSIPRDTETQLPACAGGGRGMINSALAYGPSCQVAAVVQLTGIPVDHFIDFDFSGVIDLANEVGGVPVCVSAAVHDPYSGLTIGSGVTNVQGKQALQFLRTRDAFYDGSDLGREQATHVFLSALLRKVKANATLTNLGEMQSIAETFTKYTTVDNGLDSALSLLGLGDDFGKVDADRVTLLTMPWQGDTDESDPSYQDRVEASSSAAAVFADIKDDKSFTTSSDSGSVTASATDSAVPDSGASVSPSSSASPDASGGASTESALQASADASVSAAASASEEQAARTHPMHVNVINASGATQRYQTVVSQVFKDGFVYTSGSDATTTATSTTLVYSSKEVAAAQELAADLGLPSSALEETGTGTALTLTIGTDWTSGAVYSAANSSYSPSAAVSVPSDSYEENGGNTAACVTANPDYETGSAR
ncbi:MAG TPA: LCP family protein [Actinospica sp.]|nr:LCP family protein [Actinospica sp.]